MQTGQFIHGKPAAEEIALVGTLFLVIIGLWGFPWLWYSGEEDVECAAWLMEQKSIPGWSYIEAPIEKAAERRLVADQVFSGEYRSEGGADRVLAFAAHRYSETPNDIGLFVHTPDRCWTESGWKIERAPPEYVELRVGGIQILFERRVFVSNGRRELVYFGGLLGGARCRTAWTTTIRSESGRPREIQDLIEARLTSAVEH